MPLSRIAILLTVADAIRHVKKRDARRSYPTGTQGRDWKTTEYPDCVEQNLALRVGDNLENGIFVDLTAWATSGCYKNNCYHTDKFDTEDAGFCAYVCAQIETCTHWSHGTQHGSTRCYLRKSDNGAEEGEGWSAAEKRCAPVVGRR